MKFEDGDSRIMQRPLPQASEIYYFAQSQERQDCDRDSK
jgi:hypothetical protein